MRLEKNIFLLFVLSFGLSYLMMHSLDVEGIVINSVTPANNSYINSWTFTLNITTDVAGTCKWSTIDEAYNKMTGTTTAIGLVSTTPITEISDGAKVYYIGCKQGGSTVYYRALTITLDTVKPTITNTWPKTFLYKGPFNLTATLNEVGNCRYSTANISYFSMANQMIRSGVTLNYTIQVNDAFWGFKDYYVDCIDLANNSAVSRKKITVELRNVRPYFVSPPVLEDSSLSPANQLDPIPGTTFAAWCNGTVNDYNGYSDLTTVKGTIYHSSSSKNAVDNNSVHYSNSNCSISNQYKTSGKFACRFDIQFYALPGVWTCYINASDTVGSNSSIDTSNVTELLAISIPTGTLDFGTLKPGQDSSEQELAVTNNGNIRIDVQIDASGSAIFDQNDANAMTCIQGTIPISDARYSTTQYTPFFSKTPLVQAGYVTESSFNLFPAVSGILGSKKSIFLGITAPASGTAGICRGEIEISGMSG